MIIKILPIKTKARLGGVLNYITKDKGRIKDYKSVGIYHNLLHSDILNIQNEFENNYNLYAKKRLNGNIALHIIQSFSPLDTEKMTPEVMSDLAEALLIHGYEKALAFGVQHSKDNHWHNHFIVSGNEFMDEKSTRLSKHDLYQLQNSMLEYMKDKYPEFKISYNIANWGKKLTNEREYYQTKRNPDLRLSKEDLKEKVQNLFRSSESSKNFFDKLKEEGLTTYEYKNSTFGINYGDEGKRIRFSRLGIGIDEINSLDKQFKRLQELSTLSNSQKLLSINNKKPIFHELNLIHS